MIDNLGKFQSYQRQACDLRQTKGLNLIWASEQAAELERTAEIYHQVFSQQWAMYQKLDDLVSRKHASLISELPYVETDEISELKPSDCAKSIRRILAIIKPASTKKSRVQPDHEVTAWYRKHGHKYKNKREAVRQFLQIPSDTMKKSPNMLDSLYSRLDKDLRKRPIEQPKKRRKIR